MVRQIIYENFLSRARGLNIFQCVGIDEQQAFFCFKLVSQQLSWSKLQVDTMKEEVVGVVSAGWEEDSKATNCKFCTKDFNLARRKHHCRNCGGIFCDDCSDNKMKLPSSAKSVRVCDTCYTLLLDRQSKLP